MKRLRSWMARAQAWLDRTVNPRAEDQRVTEPIGRPSFVTRLAWSWLRRRGWVWQANTPDACHNIGQRENGALTDAGWRPLFSIRYGRTPVYVPHRGLR